MYAEDGFVVYVMFRIYTNLTLLCYDAQDTSMKNTNLTEKFYYVDGQDDSWITDQGNQYLSEPVWRTTHVMNEWFLPTDESLWHDGLSVFKDTSDIFDENLRSGEVIDLLKFDYSDTSSPLFWLWYPSSEIIYPVSYYAPRQALERTSTEVYYFSLFNSASLTDGEWTQVLVEPEYVWTSVPRFDTRINIGNYFITVVVPQGDVTVDAFSGANSNIILDSVIGFLDWALRGLGSGRYIEAIGKMLRSIADAIWDGLQFLYDGATDLPGWLIGAFSTLTELIRGFGEWVYQLLMEFVGLVLNLAEELLDFVDFALQFMLFLLPFVMFMLVVNYYQVLLVKLRIAVRNIAGRKKGEVRLPDD
jgi:hypothetical protein